VTYGNGHSRHVSAKDVVYVSTIVLTQRHGEHRGDRGGAVVVEVKAARTLDPVFQRQLLTYLKIMNLRLGLVMNFGMATMKAGIRRIAN
jgi:hypothetical protein